MVVMVLASLELAHAVVNAFMLVAKIMPLELKEIMILCVRTVSNSYFQIVTIKTTDTYGFRS